MGKTTRAGGGTVAGVEQTQGEPVLLRGRRLVVKDGRLEWSDGAGSLPDTALYRDSSGVLRTTGSLQLDNDVTVTDDLTVTDDVTIGGDATVTGTTTALGYLAVGGNAGITGALDVAGSLSGVPSPRAHGLVAWAFDPATAATTGLTLTGGTIYLTKMWISRDATPTKLYWYVTAQAVTATASECWVAVLSSAGAVLGSAVDVATASETTGLKTTTVAPGALSTGTFVWGAIVLAGGTVGTVAIAPSSALTTLTNVGLTAATLRHATNGTSQTTITARTPASNSAGPAVWMALGT